MQEQMGRSPCCSETGLKKGPWTPEEDKKLLEYVQTHGHGSWQQLPKLAGLNRCGKSCRLRWTNYLRPDIKRGSFSEEEARLIIQLHSLLGNKWSSIANHLPGRTDNEIKNYWNTHLRKKLIRMGIDPATHMPRTDLNLLPSITSLLAAANYSANNSPSHLDNVLNLRAADTAILQVRLQLVQHLFQMLTSNTTSNLELLSLYGSASLINSQLENCLNLQRSISMPAASIPSFSLKPLANSSLPIPESRLSMYGAHATPSDGSLAKDVDKEIEHSGNANSCIFPSSKCIACRETTHVDPSKLLCDVSIDLPASTIPSEAWEGVDDLDVFGWK